MTTPFTKELLESEARKKGGTSGASASRSTFLDTSSAPPPLARPANIPAQQVYDDLDDSPLSSYVGNLGMMISQIPAAFLPTKFDEKDPTIMGRIKYSDFAAVGTKIENALKGTMDLFFPNEDSKVYEHGGYGMLAEIGEKIIGTFGSTTTALAEDPVGMTGQLVKGLLEMFVEAPLTVMSGKEIVGDEVLDATTDEMSSAILGTAALPISAGVYSKMARGYGGLSKTPFLDLVGKGNLTRSNMGLLGKSIMGEYAAQASAGLVQEGLSNPEDISIEMITRNIANPILLATAIPIGGLKYIKATKENVNAWGASADIINKDALVGMQSAKQITMNKSSSLKDGIDAIDSITGSDDWIEAGIEMVKKNRDRVYTLMGLGDVKADELLKQVKPVKQFFKPTIEGLPEGVVPKSGRGTTLYFKNKFDQLIATAQKGSTKKLAEQFGVTPDYMKSFQKNLAGRIAEAELLEAGNFKYRVIKDTPLPAVESQLKGYKSVNGDVMMTYRDLTPSQVKEFTQSGYMTGETVNYMGKKTPVEAISVKVPTTKTVPNTPITVRINSPKDLGFVETGRPPEIDPKIVEKVSTYQKNVTGKEPKNVFGYHNIEQNPNFSKSGYVLAENIVNPSKLDRKGNPAMMYLKGTKLTEEIIADLAFAGWENVKVYNPAAGSKVNVPGSAKLRIRPEGGKFKWVSTDEVNKVSGGEKTVWNQRTFTDDLYSRFMAFAEADRNKNPFNNLVDRFVYKHFSEKVPDSQQKIVQPGTKEKFEQFIYSKMQAETVPSKVHEGLINTINKSAENVRQIVRNKLSANGYKLEPSSSGYKIVDMDGKFIGKFDSLEEASDFALKDFQNINVPDLTARSTAPQITTEELVPTKSLSSEIPVIGSLLTPIKRLLITKVLKNPLVRRMDRRAEDVAIPTGDVTLGVKVADLVDQTSNAIDAFSQGPMKPILKQAEEVFKKSRQVPASRQAEITKALEQVSVTEMQARMTPQQIADAEAIYSMLQNSGGVSRVRTELIKIIRGEQKVKNIKDPVLAQGVVELHKLIKAGESITDEKVLRYIDVLDSGENMTSAEYIASRNWEPETLAQYNEIKNIYSEAANIFQIDNTITGYSPWIQKWDEIPDMYTKVGSESSFVHELKRIGLTPAEMRVRGANEILYRYLKSGIHHKAPLPNGKTAGEMLTEVNKAIEEIKSYSSEDIAIDVSPLQKWVGNLRGIPDIDAAQARTFEGMVGKVRDMIPGDKSIVETGMDFITFTKLAGRPILAARDMVSSTAVASLYGMDAAASIWDFSAAKLKRIEGLSKMGELQQFSADAMLSRMERSKLSKAVDVGMNLSLQPQVYRAITGNMYIHTFDKTINILNKAKGDRAMIQKLMGDLLDSNSAGVQRYFLENAVTDPLSAAKFLARRNAYNVANKFGRLTNPLYTQTKYGRAFGQFGSWSLNALTVIGESLNNSRSKSAALSKMARLAAFGTATYIAADAADLNMGNWVINPLTLIPGPGPLINYYNDLSQGLQLWMSPVDSQRELGRRKIEGVSDGLLTPIALHDLWKGSELMFSEGEYYRGLTRAMGFREDPDE